MTDLAPGPAAGQPADRRSRPLTDHETAAVIGVAIAAAGLALIGFANSFMAVTAAAAPSFGVLAPTVPLGIDLGIAVFAALDLTLSRLDMRPRWVRLIPWALTLATIWLNVAPEHTWFGRVAHAVLPGIWVLAVEAGAHVIRVRAGLAAGTAMDRVRRSRWLLAPLSTAGLWRRMVLWEVRSYPLALARERDRVLARTAMQDAYGRCWRWQAPRRERALYRLGELAPASTLPAVPAPAVPGPAAIGPAAAPRRRSPAATGTAAAVYRMRDRHPGMTPDEIGARIGKTGRTVRRHLSARPAPAPDAPAVPAVPAA
jgi:DNA-binding transcriptional ArsR family regulator